MRASWLVLLLTWGCATTDGDLDDRASELDGGAIQFLDGDLWFRTVGCPSPDPSTCVHEANLWVDLAVRNDAYDKHVGIVWIDRVRDDASAPWHVTSARYERTMPDGREVWGVDVATGLIGGNEPRPHIQLAAFAEMAGQTSWDNHDGADYLIE
jgi:hypothetical protein